MLEIDGLIERLGERIRSGALYGDFQFRSIRQPGFPAPGDLVLLPPTGDSKPIPTRQRAFHKSIGIG